MTSKQQLTLILGRLLQEKGPDYIKQVCKNYSVDDRNDRRRLKQALLEAVRIAEEYNNAIK